MKKKILFLLAISHLSFSIFDIEVKTGMNANIEGNLYKDIKSYSFNKEKDEKEYVISYITIKNKNFKTGLKLTNNNKKKEVDQEVILTFKTPKIYDFDLEYEFKYNVNEDEINKKKAGNKDHKIKLSLKDKFSLDTKINHIDKKIRKYDVSLSSSLKYVNLFIENKGILDEDLHLKESKSIQEKVNEDDNDNHNHSTSINEITFLPFDLIEAKNTYGSLSFLNQKFKLELNKDFRKKRNKFFLDSSYNYSFLKTEFGNNLKYDINSHNFDINFSHSKEVFKNLKIDSNMGYNFNKIKINKHKEKDVNRRGLLTEIMGGDVYNGINEHTFKLGTNISYLYMFSRDLSIYSSLGINTKLISKNKEIFDETYNKRKNAANLEEERARNVRENLSDEEIKNREDKIKIYENKIMNLKEEVKEFDKKENISLIISNFNNDNRNLRDDVNIRKREFEEMFLGKNYEEIEEFFNKKKIEIDEFEKLYPQIKKSRLDFITRPNENKEKRIEKFKNAAIKNNIENPDEFSEKYYELVEYNRNGIYSSIKSKIVSERRVISNRLKSKERDLENKKTEIYPDERILKSLKILDNEKKYNYELNLELIPFISLIYHLNDNLMLNTSILSEVVLSKNISKNTNMKNHIHIIPKFELRYRF